MNIFIRWLLENLNSALILRELNFDSTSSKVIETEEGKERNERNERNEINEESENSSSKNTTKKKKGKVNKKNENLKKCSSTATTKITSVTNRRRKKEGQGTDEQEKIQEQMTEEQVPITTKEQKSSSTILSIQDYCILPCKEDENLHRNRWVSKLLKALKFELRNELWVIPISLPTEQLNQAMKTLENFEEQTRTIHQHSDENQINEKPSLKQKTQKNNSVKRSFGTILSPNEKTTDKNDLFSLFASPQSKKSRVENRNFSFQSTETSSPKTFFTSF